MNMRLFYEQINCSTVREGSKMLKGLERRKGVFDTRVLSHRNNPNTMKHILASELNFQSSDSKLRALLWLATSVVVAL